MELKGFETGASKVEQALNRMVDNFQGRKVVQDATLMAAAIEKIGGVTKLTATDQDRANKLVTKAVESYTALGQVAPKALLDLQAALAKSGQGLDRLAAGMSEAGKAAAGPLIAGMSAAGRAAQETADKLKAVADASKHAALATQQLGANISQVGTQMQGVGSALSRTLTLPLVAIGAGATKVGIDFESAFAGVRKTVDATEPELQAMAQGFRTLAKEIPISVNELAKLGEAAGALGIPKGDILEFSRVMAELGVTTNVTSDQAAESIAKIQNVFGAAGKETEKFASTLVALGNEGASTEAEILALAQRISSAGNAVGLSQAQVLGFSSAIANVGIEAEAGGSAMSRVFVEIAQAVSKGGSSVAEFARVSGQSIEQFSKAFKTDAAGATTAFIEGLGKIKASGGDLIGTIEALGFTELRQADLLRRLALSGDNLSKSLKLSGVAWEENSALTKEASERFKTTESQLILLGNRIADVGITLFTGLKPAIDAALAAVNQLLPVIDALAKAFATLPGGVQLTIVGVAALAAALGPVLFVVGQLVGSVGQLVTAFGKAQSAINLVGLESVTAAGRLSTLGRAMSLLGPVALVVATAWASLEVASMIAKWIGLTDAIDRSTESQKRHVGQLQNQLSVMGNTNFILAAMAQMFKGSGDAAKAAAAEIQQVTDKVKSLKDQLSGAIATKDADALAQVVKEMAAAGELTNAVMQRLAPQIETLRAQGAKLDPVLLSIANGFKVIAAQGVVAPTGFAGLTATLKAARAELDKLSKADLTALTVAFKSGAFSIDDLKKKTGLSEEALKLFQDQVQKSESALKKLESAQASASKRFQEAKANLEALFDGADWDGTIQGALKLGASVKDLAVFFGVAEGEVKKSKRELDVWAKVAIVEADRSLQGFESNLHKLGVAVPQKFFDDMKSLPDRIFAIEHGLDANHLTTNLKNIGQIVSANGEKWDKDRQKHEAWRKEFDKSQVALSNLKNALAGLSGVFTQLAQLGGDRFSAFGRTIGVAVKGAESMIDAMETLNKVMNLTKAEGGGWTASNIASLAAGWAGVAVAIWNVVQALEAAHAAAVHERFLAAWQKELRDGFNSVSDFSTSVRDQIIADQTTIGELFTRELVASLRSGINQTVHTWEELGRAFDTVFADAGKAATALHIVDIVKELGGGASLSAAQLGMVNQNVSVLFDLIRRGGTIGVKATNELLALMTELGDRFELDQLRLQILWAEVAKGGDAAAQAMRILDQVFAGAFDGLTKAFADVGNVLTPAMKKLIDQLLASGHLTDDMKKKLQELVSTGLDFDKLDAIAKKYGTTLSHLGGQLAQSGLDREFTDIFSDLQTLIKAGGDVDKILDAMSGSFSKLIQDAKKFGLTVPIGLKPYLQSLVDSGKLVDENGKKLKDLSGITFADTPLVTALDLVAKKLQDLINLLLGIVNRANDAAGALAELTPHLPGTITVPTQPEIPVEAQRLTRSNVLSFVPRAAPRAPSILPAETIAAARTGTDGRATPPIINVTVNNRNVTFRTKQDIRDQATHVAAAISEKVRSQRTLSRR